MSALGPWSTRLAKLEVLTKPHQADAVVRQARRAPAPDQVASLTEALAAMDEAQRQAVYATLTDGELEALCGAEMCAYLQTLSDTQIQRVVADQTGREARKGLRAYRQWKKYR